MNNQQEKEILIENLNNEMIENRINKINKRIKILECNQKLIIKKFNYLGEIINLEANLHLIDNVNLHRYISQRIELITEKLKRIM